MRVLVFLAGCLTGALAVSVAHAVVVEEAVGIVSARHRELEERLSSG